MSKKYPAEVLEDSGSTGSTRTGRVGRSRKYDLVWYTPPMFIARRVLKSNQREDHLVQVGEH
eukprot:SAG11_NODE_7447_length_1142_cov_8.808245_2_plen_61_part_01